MADATLIAHAGAEKLSRAEVSLIHPAIQATRTFKPIAHGELLDTLDYALQLRGIETLREEYAVARKGAQLFGVKDLRMSSLSGVTAALGIRAANDRSMSVRVVVGARVFVCDNLSISGSDGIALRKKHTSGLNLQSEMVIAVDTFASRYLVMEKKIGQLQERELSDDRAKALILDAFAAQMVPQRLLPAVVKAYFEPLHEEFKPRTAWSLVNAFTEVFKQLPVISAQESNTKVSRLLGLTSTNAQSLVLDTVAV